MDIEIRHSSNVFHDKLFKVSWNSSARWVLIYYRNGQKKTWYKSPGRGYRFQRWFLKKGVDDFKNLGNFNYTKVIFFFFPRIISFPVKKEIHFSVNYLQVTTEPFVINRHSLANRDQVLQMIPAECSVSNNSLRIKGASLEIQSIEKEFVVHDLVINRNVTDSLDEYLVSSLSNQDL